MEDLREKIADQIQGWQYFDCAGRESALSAADEILALFPKQDRLIPDTFMGYEISELREIINFAKSRGYKQEPQEQDILPLISTDFVITNGCTKAEEMLIIKKINEIINHLNTKKL